ncbi:MAG: MerR family transcriptional regulator [Mycobacteriales bacterium]
MSIGEVLATLRPDFPDITISKIRFLESEGLISPERTPSGYRKFTEADLERLRYVLAAQRDQYLPLRVIREHLDALDRGLEPPESTSTTPQPPRSLFGAGDGPRPDDFVSEPAAEVRLSRTELMEASGLTEEQMRAVEQYGLVAPRRQGGYYDGDAVVIARIVAELADYGIEARHLRAFRSAADREVGLFEQVVTPLVRQRNPEARARAAETVRELAALSVRLHATLVKAGLRGVLGG